MADVDINLAVSPDLEERHPYLTWSDCSGADLDTVGNLNEAYADFQNFCWPGGHADWFSDQRFWYMPAIEGDWDDPTLIDSYCNYSYVGQNYGTVTGGFKWSNYYTFFMWDHRDIPVDAVIDSVTFKLYYQNNTLTNQEFDCWVYPLDFREDDYWANGAYSEYRLLTACRPGAWFKRTDRLASARFSYTPGSPTYAYVQLTFTSDSAFVDYIQKGGVTKFVCVDADWVNEVDTTPCKHWAKVLFPVVNPNPAYGYVGKEATLDVVWH